MLDRVVRFSASRPNTDIPADPAVLRIEEKCVLEINVGCSRNHFLTPAHSTVVSPRDKALPPRDPHRGCIYGGDTIDRRYRRRTDILRRPVLSAVGGVQDKVVEADRPAILRIEKGDRSKFGATGAELFCPVVAAIGRLVNARPDDPAGGSVEEENAAEPGIDWTHIAPVKP